ncbi:MAG: hypothetical protein Ct9H300mP1_04460 [Planctomycetaceae bacterium]|nr:MAG: hypothetical protein Ct9H300mP1_04460 [Planctomycetaceae bacterium]
MRAKSQPEQRPGPLVIVGGGGTPESVGRHFVKLSGGRQARIAVLPQASSRPDRGASSVKMFQSLGSQSFIVNLEDCGVLVNGSRVDSNLVSRRKPVGIVQGLDKAGLSADPPAARPGTGCRGYQCGRGGDVGGHDPRSPETQTLRSGNTPSASGLGLVPGLIIDQHFVRRRRMNRLVGIVLTNPAGSESASERPRPSLLAGDVFVSWDGTA